MNLVGQVADGHGSCQKDVRRGLYASVDSDLYPGSLNVELGHDGWLKSMPDPDRVILHPHSYQLLMWRAVAGDIPVWAMWPNRMPKETHIELFAQVRLRDVLQLSTGDRLEVVL